MNVENILKLATLIEGLPEGKFDMRDTLKEGNEVSCGTPACIAGWAAWMQQGKPEVLHDNRKPWSTGENDLITSALEFMGVPNITENPGLFHLVIDDLFGGDQCGSDLAHVTNAQAAEALRNFADTGEVEPWDLSEGDE